MTITGLYYNEQPNYEEGDAGLAPLPDGKVACLKCGKTLSNVQNGKRHYATSHQPNKPEKCNICKKMCKNAQARDAHLRSAHGVTPAMMKKVIAPPPIKHQF